MHQFPKFILAWNSTCFGQFLYPSSGVYSLCIRQWHISYRFEDSFRTGQGWSCSKAVFKPVWHIPLPTVQWINSWWWAEELSETCKVSCRSKFGKFVQLVWFYYREKEYRYSVSNLEFINIFVAVCASCFISTLNSPTAQTDLSLIFVWLYPSTVFENKTLLFVPCPWMKE